MTVFEIEERFQHLLYVTRVQQTLLSNKLVFEFRDEYNTPIAFFTTFIEAYRYRLVYISSKLEGEK